MVLGDCPFLCQLLQRFQAPPAGIDEIAAFGVFIACEVLFDALGADRG